MTATVYECSDCGERTDQRRCEDCNQFTRRAGAGGHCPSCDELILVEELLDQTNQIAPPYTEHLTSSRTPRFYGDTTTTPSPVTTNHYDSAGRVDWQSDPLGRTTSFDYTTIAGSTKVTDPLGNVTVEEYQYGLLTAVTRGYGTSQAASTYYRYDPATLGQSTVIDANAGVTQSVFDAAGNRTSTTDSLKRTTSYTYNALNEVTAVTEPKQVNGTSIATTTTYDAAGNLLTRSAPLLDASGATIATSTTTYHYDDPAHPGDATSITDPNNNTVTMIYDGYGDLTSRTDAAGETTTFGYDTGRGWKTSMVAPRGNVTGGNPAAYTTTYGHDAYGRVTITRDPLWTSTAPTQHQTVNHYDADGNLDSVTDGNNHTTGYTYDAAGEQTAITRADGSILRTDYWADGTIHDQYDGAGQPTTYLYDPLGRLADIAVGGLGTTGYAHDPVGNVVLKVDPTGRMTTSTYDAANELTSISYSDAITPNVTNISYDADGQRTAMTDGTGTSTWGWDTLHRMTSSTNGAGATVGYQYDLGGRLTGIVYPGSTGTVTRGYDSANRLHTVTDWNGKTTTFNYDADSNLQSQIYPNTTTATNTFDAAGRLMAISDAPTANPNAPFASFSYGRDGADHLSSVTATGVPADTHTYSYDQISQLTGVDASTYSYDTANNLTKQTDNTQQIYNTAHELTATTTSPPISLVGTTSAGDSTSTSLTLTLPAGTTTNDQVLLAATLPYSKNVTTPTGYSVVNIYSSGTANSSVKMVVYRRTAAAGDTSVTVTFSAKFAKSLALGVYRSVHPSTPIEVSSSASAAPGTLVSAPSLATTSTGDRLVMITGASGTAGTWSMPPTMTTRVQRAGGTTDTALADENFTGPGDTGYRVATHSVSTQIVGVVLALKPAQTSYTYDREGNRTSITPLTGSPTTLTYDQANRLTGYGTSATYSYNGDGLRASKTASGVTTRYTWDQAGTTPLLLNDGTTNYVYGPNDLPIEQIAASGTLYYHHDQLGSTRVLTDSSGNIAAAYTYNAYGQLTSHSGTADTPLRWAGQYQDSETSLYYLRARYYDPTTAEFLTRDPLEANTRSAYGYVAGDPLDISDPSGLCFGPDWLCHVVNDVWHPVRFVATLPVTLPTLAIDKIAGADCRWNGANWVDVCYGAPTILGAPATTFGDVVNTSYTPEQFSQANCGRLLAHETKHTDQWAIFGPIGFPILDGLGAGGSKLFFGDNAHNPFEIWAGLKDGGYQSCGC